MPDFPDVGIQPGRRIAIFGRAGSGKSYLTKYAILRSLTMRWAVLDTKHDPLFSDWRPVTGLPDMGVLAQAWKHDPIVTIRPTPSQMNRDAIDGWLGELHDAYDGFGVAIDETYQIAYGAFAGPGFTGLVTRGRVRNQSVIMGAQRPAWVPRFVMSEANGYVIMSLNMRADRKRVADMTGDTYYQRVMSPLPPRHWMYYDVATDRMRMFDPVTITRAPAPDMARQG